MIRQYLEWQKDILSDHFPAPLENSEGLTKYMLSVKIEGTAAGINPIIFRPI